MKQRKVSGSAGEWIRLRVAGLLGVAQRKSLVPECFTDSAEVSRFLDEDKPPPNPTLAKLEAISKHFKLSGVNELFGAPTPAHGRPDISGKLDALLRETNNPLLIGPVEGAIDGALNALEKIRDPVEPVVASRSKR